MSDRLVHCLRCNQLFTMSEGSVVQPCACVPVPPPVERWEGDDNIKLAMEPEGQDDGLSDVEADAMTLASAGMGTDEDYGYFGDGEDREGSWGEND